jgi:polyhydroxybutyrate depolymerase
MVAAGAAGVVSAQVVAQAINVPSVASGAVLVLLQAGGPVFVALFTVIVFGACRELVGRAAARCWAVCLGASVLTYVTWTGIYFIADGGWPRPLQVAATGFAQDLLTGSARPQLGLVLVAVQICALMPAVRWLIRVTRGAHLTVFLVSLVLQLAISVCVHWPLPVREIPPGWLAGAARLLPSYVLFLVVGALLVDDRDEVGVWIGRHLGWILACVIAAIVLSEASYGSDIAWRHLTPARAAQPVQPAAAIAGLAALAGLYALGVRWAARRRPRPLVRLVSGWSDASTGIYLLAPLLVQAALAATYFAGLIGPLPRLDEAKTIALELGCGLPLLLGGAWLLTTWLRGSSVSVVLTGRARLRPAGVAGPDRMTWSAGAGLTGLAVVLAIALGAQLSPRVFAEAGRAIGPRATPIVGTVSAASPVAAATVATMHTIPVGGLQRTYEVIQPQKPAATKLPVFVFLHGIDADITTEEDRDGLLPLVTDSQAILVYPAGYEESWNDGACCTEANAHGVDDLAFLADVVHEAATIPGADPARVYVVGYSDGGKMAYHLICQEPRLVTGAVIIAALPVSACPPGAPVPLLQVTGDNDPVNPYQDVLQQVSGWLVRDTCTTSSATRTYDTLTLQSWSTCAQGSRVELATYAGAGHGPFGGNGSPQLGQLMLSFVNHSPLGG